MGVLVIIGVVFGLCYLQTLNEEAKNSSNRNTICLQNHQCCFQGNIVFTTVATQSPM